MRVVVALGGNAILRRGQEMSIANQRASIAEACGPLARIAAEHELVVSHGNGPQVGLLALQAAAYDSVSVYPFDVLGAQTEGMIGYLIEQELGNRIGNDKTVATLVTRTLVDREDPAFQDPSKFIGPIYTEEVARSLASEKGWSVKRDGNAYRRVVPSPEPLRILETKPIEWIIREGGVVICAGGGGVPTTFDTMEDVMAGVEAVIDKDLASAVLARDLHADLLVIATDVAGVFRAWGTHQQELLARVNPRDIDPADFPPGSMGPKVRAAQQFSQETGRVAVIGSLSRIDDLMAGTAGTQFSPEFAGAEYRKPCSETG